MVSHQVAIRRVDCRLVETLHRDWEGTLRGKHCRLLVEWLVLG